MDNFRETIDQKLKKLDSQINYMKQVIEGRSYPSQAKDAAKKSLEKLEEERNKLLTKL